MRSVSFSLVLGGVKESFRQSVDVCLKLMRVMIPVIVAVKLLKEFGLISYLALPLAPVMELVGLPASMGLVWATGLVNTIYGAMAVFVSLAPTANLSVAQITVLSVMLLIAHGLPVELKIARLCGPGLLAQGAIRVGAALLCGLCMHLVFSGFGLLQQPGAVLWTPDAPPATHLAWALGEARNLLAIFGIIFALMLMMKVLDGLGVTRLMGRILEPVLRRIGIGPEASAVTVAGLTLGLSYGSGLIINEVDKGTIGRRDVFNSLSLMGLAHALIEDTMLVLMLGANFNGIFWGRLAFTLVFMIVLVRVVARLPRKVFDRFLMPAAT
ncbi:nucleoside recognition domain-containing protein [Desulfocurvus sp. DL9XJH121]